MGENFHRKELSASDLEGVAIVQEISSSLNRGRGHSIVMFLLGLSLADLPFALAGTGSLPVVEKYPELFGLAGLLLSKATKAIHRGHKAVLFTKTISYGVQLGASGMVGLAFVNMGDFRLPHDDPAEPIKSPNIPPGPEDLSISSRSSNQVDVIIPSDILFMFDDDQFKSDTKKITCSFRTRKGSRASWSQKT